jgi:hypothetical protein
MEALITFLRGGTGGGAAPLLTIIVDVHLLVYQVFLMPDRTVSPNGSVGHFVCRCLCSEKWGIQGIGN